MKTVTGAYKDGILEVVLTGHIDSNNAAEVEADINELLDGREQTPITLNARDLEYISSAGLRVLLHLKKKNPDLKITDVRTEVYEILDMTGFTQMMEVTKAFREVSVEGCEKIGHGANGTLYRIDQDNVVKVYNNADALDDIQHEREVARLALILGIPTAISYDVVRVGNSYGSVFELLNARSFSRILAEEPEKMDWCVNEYVKMLKKLHETEVPEGKLPDMRETALSWAEFVKDYLPEEQGNKLLSLIREIPRDNHMIHGDYHTQNLMVQGDDILLIDMDTLAVGHPIFELGSIFNAFTGFSELDHSVIMDFQGFDFETAQKFFHKVMRAYLGTDDEGWIQSVIDKARVIGYTRLMRREIRRNGLDTEKGREKIAFWQKELGELLEKTDTLLFDRSELDIEADISNLQAVLDFVEKHLSAANCPVKAGMQITVAVEEIFVNIANYAYAPQKGRARVRVEISEEPIEVTITFIDKGVPYDPLKRQDPDVTLPAVDREIGGLGIFLVKKTMDDVTYEYKDGQNILKLKKNLK